MTNEKREVVITGLRMDLTDALKNIVTDKVDRLFDHEPEIQRIRVELEYDVQRTKESEFNAKGHIEIPGKPLIVSVGSDNEYKSIDLMVDKLDRMLRRRARLSRVKRKNVSDVDFGAEAAAV